jgi:hypothetical protein
MIVGSSKTAKRTPKGCHVLETTHAIPSGFPAAKGGVIYLLI